MATPQQRFAEALKILKELQDKGNVAIYTDEIPNRTYRELLLKNGFIKEVSRGWYIPSNPEENDGDSTYWYSSYWEFCAKFLNKKYGTEWCLSADQSLNIHAGNWTVPFQLIIRAPQSNNTPTTLPHGTSLFNTKSDLPEANQITIERNIRMYNLPASLIYCTSRIYTSNPIEVRTALSLIRDASELLPILLEKGHTTIGGRLAGAFRNIKREKIADQIMETMKSTGYDIREEDPFTDKLNINLSSREKSPFVNRIKLMWQAMREVIIKDFPAAPGIPKDTDAYLKNVDDQYITDAYHSLSIERYKVTPELIERVTSGLWDKNINAEDKKQKDAMAARGYWQAFQVVKETIIKVLKNANPGTEADKDHHKWYRQLFDPSVSAGILKVSDLSGYRNNQVYIGGSKQVPLNVDAMRDAMPILFELLENEKEPFVKAVLGHFIFVFIHPYMDGNGRIARFLMNVMLASGGYPWTVIPVEQRSNYMKALESASVNQDITPFSQFIAYLVSEGLKGKPVAHLS
ncbi:Fic family protein [Solitalea lacus]|uniref:Fic family protein n=1 Tax=Solitalea lacus TaxID=2911172 RepID=UPI001EDC0277|nr:Fic family protein [Solitalea lacus]UKJ09242.1 Fic family protein [Solitalea lacus]